MPTIHICHPNNAPDDIPILHIQAKPPGWLQATCPRSVPVLCPTGAEVEYLEMLLRKRWNGEVIPEQLLNAYRNAYTARIEAQARVGALDPDWLRDDRGEVITGDVALVCTCSSAEAEAGRCHRMWAGEVLAQTGKWSIVYGKGESTEKQTSLWGKP
jgi:hypothetical protein